MRGWSGCGSFRAIHLGHPKIRDNPTLKGLLLPIPRRFDQYACVRPAGLNPGVASPLAGKRAGRIDVAVGRTGR